MSADAEREARLVRYLLGELPPAEREALEEGYFSDPALHEDVEAVADDLIHDYLSGDLSADERRRFESHFLASPRQRERMELVRDVLAKVAPPRPASSSPVPRVSLPSWLAQAAVLAALALLLVLLRPRSPAPIDVADARPRPTAPTATPVVPAEPPLVRVARAAKDVDVAVPTGAPSVRFEIAVDGFSASYDAIVRALDGAELWRANDLEIERDGAPVRFSVPAAILAAGQYVLALEGEALRGTAPKPVVQCTLRVRRDP